MTRSTSFLSFALALALGASAAAQGQTLPGKDQAETKKSAAAAKAAPKVAPGATAKDVLRGAAPAVSGATKAAPEPMRSISPAKDGYSDCYSKDSDA